MTPAEQLDAALATVKGRIIGESWAIIRPDGQIAGDGESPCIHHARESAERDLSDEAESLTGWRTHLRRINNLKDGEQFRIAKVVTVEVGDE